MRITSKDVYNLRFFGSSSFRKDQGILNAFNPKRSRAHPVFRVISPDCLYKQSAFLSGQVEILLLDKLRLFLLIFKQFGPVVEAGRTMPRFVFSRSAELNDTKATTQFGKDPRCALSAGNADGRWRKQQNCLKIEEKNRTMPRPNQSPVPSEEFRGGEYSPEPYYQRGLGRTSIPRSLR